YNHIVPVEKQQKTSFYRKLIGVVVKANIRDKSKMKEIVQRCLVNDSGKISGLRRAESLLLIYNEVKYMRQRTLKQILEKRYKIIELGGILKDMFGQVEQNGLWLIWGDEKMGKSTFSIVLADHFANTGKKVLYVMA